PHTNTIVSVTMGLILMNLSTFSEIPESGDDYEHALIYKVLKYIETNYKAGTLSEISGNLNLPEYTVSRLLKKYTGHNFKELLKQQKLQQAVFFLENSNMSIDNIIESLGYNNSSFFYRSFKDKYGVSPNNYRKTTGRE
ncbi:MAG: helix-turn-helix transcriptional regulator, partial [Lachnospiraceae bacterium]|nr:helix-turn-helix transcriptional regulator [Lachnospiraceae bacterium]